MGMTGAVEQYIAASESRPMDREALVMEHLPQVLLIARRIHRRLPPHYSLDDLISTGVVGLLEAIDRYDPSMQVQLNTFAEHRIRGAIQDSLRDLDLVPRDSRRKARQIEAAMAALSQRLGREPAEEEIAAELRLDLRQYQQWLSETQEVELQPLEYASGDERHSSLLKFLPDNEDRSPAHVVERAELERILALAIERMPKVDRTILTLYYFEDLTLSQISRVVGLHVSRVAELRVQGVLRLRSHLQRVWPARSKQ